MFVQRRDTSGIEQVCMLILKDHKRARFISLWGKKRLLLAVQCAA